MPEKENGGKNEKWMEWNRKINKNKIARNSEKIGKKDRKNSGKIVKKRKNWEKAKIGKVHSICPSWVLTESSNKLFCDTAWFIWIK